MANVVNVMMGLVFTVIAFVILVFMLGMGGTMLTNLQAQQCGDMDGTYGGYTQNGTVGCCGNVLNSTWCYDSFNTSFATNMTGEGLDGLMTMAEWTPTMSLAITIGAVVTILLTFIGGAMLVGGRA